MKRETQIHRTKENESSFRIIQYSIEEWFENYYERPVEESEYKLDSELVVELLNFVNNEFDEPPVLVINNVGRREYFFDEYRKAFDPYYLSETLKSIYDTVLETNEENIGAEWIYKTIYEVIKPKIEKRRMILASHNFTSRQFIQKHPNKKIFYPDQLEIKIYDYDEWRKLKGKNILYITSGDGPCFELLKMWDAKKVICVYSFNRIKNPD